jgi:hypothetical protein
MATLLTLIKLLKTFSHSTPILSSKAEPAAVLSNGARQSNGVPTFSKTQIANMSNAEYEKANREAIIAATKAKAITD